MLGATASSNNQWMADNGFMGSSALDTRVETLGGLHQPHMVAENRTQVAIPVPVSSQTNLYFTTGSSNLSAFPVITGYDGYVTVADNATIELSDNFTIEASGWIDTTTGVDKNLAYKRSAFNAFVNPTVSGNITAAILGTASANETLYPDGHSVCVIPNEAGVACPDHYQNVDEVGINDADYVEGAIGAGIGEWIDWYTLDDTALGIVPNVDITAVTLRIRGMVVGGGDAFANFRGFLKIGSDNSSGAVHTNAAFTTHSENLTRPGGGSWQVADLDGLLIGVEVKAKAGGTDSRVSWINIVIYYNYDTYTTQISALGVSSGNHTVRVTYLPNLLSNGNFEVGDPPTGWALGGAGATVGRSTTEVKIDTYSANLTKNVGTATLTQAISNYADYRGREVTIGAWISCNVSDTARLRISDGVFSKNSSYHTGSGNWEWITVTRAVGLGATQLKVICRIDGANALAYLDGAILVEGDAIPDFNTFRIFIDDVEQDQTYTETPVPDTATDWILFQNNVMPWVGWFKIWKSEID